MIATRSQHKQYGKNIANGDIRVGDVIRLETKTSGIQSTIVFQDEGGDACIVIKHDWYFLHDYDNKLKILLGHTNVLATFVNYDDTIRITHTFFDNHKYD